MKFTDFLTESKLKTYHDEVGFNLAKKGITFDANKEDAIISAMRSELANIMKLTDKRFSKDAKTLDTFMNNKDFIGDALDALKHYGK